MIRKRTRKRTRNKRTRNKKTANNRYYKKKRQSIKRKKKQQVPKNNIIKFESDYLNLRLRYLRGSKRTKEHTKELNYLESLLKSLKKKQHN